jgi:hypothetical protein
MSLDHLHCGPEVPLFVARMETGIPIWLCDGFRTTSIPEFATKWWDARKLHEHIENFHRAWADVPKPRIVVRPGRRVIP